MNKKQISILACGWLGFPLAKSFLEKGYQVKGSTTSPEKINLLKEAGINATLLNLDTADAKTYKDFLADSELLIINIPPGRPVVKGRYAGYMANVLAHIPATMKVIFISSTSVYPNTNDWVDENNDLTDKANGAELVAAESLLQNTLKERLSILRFAGLIGYDRVPGRFLANKKALKNGDSPVNLIHRDDCIGLIHAIVSKQMWNEVFNGVADIHPLRKDFYKEAAIKQGLTAPSFIENEPSEFKIVSNKKSKTLLDFTYQFPDPYEVL